MENKKINKAIKSKEEIIFKYELSISLYIQKVLELREDIRRLKELRYK